MKKKSPATPPKPALPRKDADPADKPFSVIGVGTSAGGLKALTAFFSALKPADIARHAIIVVQHLEPDHGSILDELIQRHTKMKVREAVDGLPVQPGAAYIIPPNCDMALSDGILHLFEPSAPRGHRLPIDFFFRSLAQDLSSRAIGIVLSGAGSDGTEGLKAIKRAGGRTLVQSPVSADYDSMPRHAIDAGVADAVVSPADMPAALRSTAARSKMSGKAPAPAGQDFPEDFLKKICILVQNRTGHDFSQYKTKTLSRRIERRMTVQHIRQKNDLLLYLQRTPSEIDTLFQDFLIGVTSFFRDPEAFKVLEKKVIPEMLHSRAAGSYVRIWVPGCSTGEEAYSIGILLLEYAERLKTSFRVQIFATDIDRAAIAKARAGLFPASLAGAISPERLRRFFLHEPDGSYRIHKRVREMVIFSEQDLIKDPPFSRLDLISCRNLLIYLQGHLQKRVIRLFQYALNPHGLLFLGTSETTGDSPELFLPIDRTAKIYRKNEELRIEPSAQVFPPLVERQILAPGSAARGLPASKNTLPPHLVERSLPAGTPLKAAIVTESGDVLYLHGQTERYLQPMPEGGARLNLLKMAHSGLRRALGLAFHKATSGRTNVTVHGIKVRNNGETTHVDIAIGPLEHETEVTKPHYLVIFEETLPAPAKRDSGPEPKAAPAKGGRSLVARLKAELTTKNEFLESTCEALETSNEELKSSNEEMQSMNEELQSTNEELETSKEELQSLNEELATLNAELQTKVIDLSKANNDINNLMAGTGIGTIFVDQNQLIQRFTPSAAHIINLIPADVGRPIGHIVTNLPAYDDLVADVQSVLDTLVPKEIEVQARDGGWFLLRIRPYRTLENVIAGAVITFIEITDIKKAGDAIKEAQTLRHLAAVVRDARDAIIVRALDGRILAWNPAATRIYGWTEEEALQMNILALMPPEEQSLQLKTVWQISEAHRLDPSVLRRIAKGGAVVEVSVVASPLVDATGTVYAILTTERTGGGQTQP